MIFNKYRATFECFNSRNAVRSVGLTHFSTNTITTSFRFLHGVRSINTSEGKITRGSECPSWNDVAYKWSILPTAKWSKHHNKVTKSWMEDKQLKWYNSYFILIVYKYESIVWNEHKFKCYFCFTAVYVILRTSIDKIYPYSFIYLQYCDNHCINEVVMSCNRC